MTRMKQMTTEKIIRVNLLNRCHLCAMRQYYEGYEQI